MEDEITFEQIRKESECNLLKGDAGEMTDIIYDTLLGNTQFPQFDIEKITPIDEYDDCQVCDRKRRCIVFGYCGHEYKMEIKLVK